MAARTLPNIGLTAFWGTGFDGWGDAHDQNILKTSVLTQARALAVLSARPSSPTDGQVYILNAGAGADANKIIIRDAGAWVDMTPLAGWKFYVVATGLTVQFDGSEWLPVMFELPDTAGKAGYVLGVNPAGTGYELVQIAGGVTTVANAALKYRFKITTAGVSGEAGFSEIDTYARDLSQVFPSVVTASSSAAGFPVSELEDDSVGNAGNGWMCDTGAESAVGAWVEFEYAEPVGLLSVVFYAMDTADDTAQGVDVEYYDEDAATWTLLNHYDMTWGPSTVAYTATPLDEVTVSTTTGGTFLTDAPEDGTSYGRKDGAWVAVGGAEAGAFDGTWNGDTDGPTKDAIFDLVDTDTALAANSDFKVPSQKAVKAYIANQVAGLWQFQGLLDASGNPNYPAGAVGDTYLINVGGKVGGASGKVVEVGDLVVCVADNVGGTEAGVGVGWSVLQGNILSVAPPDADYGDVTVSSGGTVWTIDNSAVSYAKIQNISTTSRVLGRKTAGAGVIEELTVEDILAFIAGSTQGDILVHGASGWQRLAAGTAGYVLQTNGPASNPSWVSKPAVVTGGASGSRPWYWAPKAAASFTLVSNSGTSTISDDTEVGTIVTGAPGGANQRHLWYEGLTGGANFDLKAHAWGSVTGLAATECGIGIRESATGKTLVVEMTSSGLQVVNMASGLNGARSAVINATMYTTMPLLFMRIARVSGNILIYYSHNGKTWDLWTTLTMTTYFTVEPNQAGLWWNLERTSGPNFSMTCDYYELT